LEAPLAFVDLEMTGLDPNVDRVIEVCVVRKRGEVVEESLETLVNPGKDALSDRRPRSQPGAPRGRAILFRHRDRVLSILDGAVLSRTGPIGTSLFLEAELARLGQPYGFLSTSTP
jgi:hypothetical protein